MGAKVNRLVIGLALVCCVVAQVGAQMTGGLGEEQLADEHIEKIISSVAHELHTKYPEAFASVEPISYKTQLVAGMNYFVKAVVTEKGGQRKHVHLRIYRPLAGPNVLTSIKTDVDVRSPLKYFQ